MREVNIKNRLVNIKKKNEQQTRKKNPKKPNKKKHKNNKKYKNVKNHEVIKDIYKKNNNTM